MQRIFFTLSAFFFIVPAVKWLWITLLASEVTSANIITTYVLDTFFWLSLASLIAAFMVKKASQESASEANRLHSRP